MVLAAYKHIFIIFALKLNCFTMTDMNQIKVVFVQKKMTGKWLT